MINKPKSKIAVYESINRHIDAARSIALDYVISEARNILKENEDLVEFVIGRAVYFFVDSEGNDVDVISSKLNPEIGYYTYIDSRPSFLQLNSFIDKWDAALGITCECMRVTADSDIITDW